MFWQIFVFELQMRFRSKALWFCWAIFALKGVSDVLSAQWELMMPSRVPLNSPFSIYYLLMFASFWAQLLAVGFMAQPLLRDISVNAAPLVFSKPVTDRGYLLGKYFASLLGLVFVMSGTAISFVILPAAVAFFGIETPVPLLATPWAHLAHGFLLWTAITCFAYGTMHFSLAALIGRLAPSYALAVVFFLVFLAFTVNYGNNEFDKPLIQILDPLGKSTSEAQIFYWSAEERTRNFISLSGNLLLNRLVYLSLGVVALGLSVWRFDLRKLLEKSRRSTSRRSEKQSSEKNRTEVPVPVAGRSAVTPVRSRAMSFGEQVLFAVRTGWLEFARLFGLNPFRIVILVFAVMAPLFALDLWMPKPDGLLLPSAIYQMKLVGEILFPVIMLAMLYFVGEILGREQVARVKPLIDATPIETWPLYVGKVLAVVLLAAFFSLFTPLGVVLVQLLRGFPELNPLTLLNATVFVMLPNLLAFAMLGVIFYAVLNSKIPAQVFSLIAAFSVIILAETEALNHRLLLYALPAESAWTDFAANGTAIVRYGFGGIYWLAFAGLFVIAAYWLWARGSETSFMLRLREAARRLKPMSVGIGACLLIVFSLTGWWMYRNINLLNDYKTTDEELAEKADYERKYSMFADLVQPKITAARLSIDLHPAKRSAEYKALFQLQNRTNETISDLHLETAEKVVIDLLSYNDQPLEPVSKDEAHRHHIYKLPASLAPGETATLETALSVAYVGFPNEDVNGTLQPDGSVFTAELLPRFGYDREREIHKESERRLHDLGPRRPLPSVSEVAANPEELARNLAANDDADFVAYETFITTDADQTVAAPGRLIADTTSGNRRTFHFRDEKAGLWDFYFTSARYAVTHGTWQNGDLQIPIEIYHLPTHSYNAQRFIESVQFALDHLSRDFGEYPHQSLRIAEVPNEAIEPTTTGNLIILPEKKGWLHDYTSFDANNDLDFVQFILAQEVARGWWGQTAAPAEAKGYPLLIDAMPTYAALSVLEARHGETAALRQISNLTDKYLRESAIEDGREPSLLEAEEQGYINDKGAVALFTVSARLGKEQVNTYLKNYLDGLRHRTAPPFTRADEFVAALAAHTDSEQRAFLEQIFQTVTTYDYKLRQAVAQPELARGFKLLLDIEAQKFLANQTDNRVETQMSEPLEVAVYLDDRAEPLIVQTPAIISGYNRIELEFDQKPLRVQLDPRRLLVDRNQMDNAAAVRFQ